MIRSANRPILDQRVNLWWYALALVPIVLLGWLSLINLIPTLLMTLFLLAAVFWLASLTMAVIAKLRTPHPESRS
ncbi:hypothetical protein [Devosia sp.]|uniref:hypothetical protein n=1 Tax=Devosia sp. TaxID=1871048 RepID=UPI003A91F6E3